MMTKEASKRPINRLKSMYALRALVDQMYQGGIDAGKQGRPVAWCMQDPFTGPILNAMDIESVYPENFGTVCAASEGAAAAFLERAEADGFPTHLCGYARNCLGYTARMLDMDGIPPEAPGGGMPRPTVLLASGIACDSRFKWFQALGRYLDAPVYIAETPMPGAKESLMEGAHERDIKVYTQEIRDLVAFLEKTTGRKMDWDKFSREVDATMEMDKAFWEVNELRKARPGPMHSRDFWSSMTASLFRASNPTAVKELYRQMYEEVKYRVDNKISGINREEKYRLLFEGIPPWHSLKIFDELAERGWNFVTERIYHPPRPIDLSMYSDPAERLARYRFQGMSHLIDAEFAPEEAAQIKAEIMEKGFSDKVSVRYARDYQVDGAFIHSVLSCRALSAPLNLFQAQVMAVWKVPSLTVEGDMVDTSLFDPAEVLRKAEAFEETMDYYKKVRQQAGLEW